MQPAQRSLPPEAFARTDPSDDGLFYAAPRFVTHIDDAAIAALTGFYARILPCEGAVLDLMSSWVSHLPPSFAGDVVGHGLNAEELNANPRLTRSFVQDLNRRADLPLEDGGCDAALCCAGVQYLARPDAVFAEVLRTLRPGAPFIVSFSNRCFPTKAVAVWRALDARGHADLIAHYLRHAGFERISRHMLRDGSIGDPLTAVVGCRPAA